MSAGHFRDQAFLCRRLADRATTAAGEAHRLRALADEYEECARRWDEKHRRTPPDEALLGNSGMSGAGK